MTGARTVDVASTSSRKSYRRQEMFSPIQERVTAVPSIKSAPRSVGGVRTVMLPSPDAMRSRWAALSAVSASRGPLWARGCYGTDLTWHFDDGGGNWADLRWFDHSRAVLVGYDHEYSETYFGAAAEYFGRAGTDLLAGVPQWWSQAIADYLERQRRAGDWIGFVYGFEGGRWTRAEYAEHDGFDSLGLPFVDDTMCGDRIVNLLDFWAREDHGHHAPDLHAVAAVLGQGPALDKRTADALLRGYGLDTDAALSAVRPFAPD